jgi:hypothetical protein
MKDFLLRAADAVDWEMHKRSSHHHNCIDASRVLVDVLASCDFFAICEPVRVQFWTAAGWAKNLACQPLLDRDRPVGGGHTHEVATDGFNGHMVALAKKRGTSEFWLIDPTARQYSNRGEDRVIDAPLAETLANFGAPNPCSQSLMPDEGVTILLPSGVRAIYDEMPKDHPQLLATDLEWESAMYDEEVAAVLSTLRNSTAPQVPKL